MPLPWAFTPWRAIEPPAVSDQDWQQPVDRFGSAAHLALALIGNSRASTERQCLAGPLDALSASPHQDERKARHWSGLARYDDFSGFDENG